MTPTLLLTTCLLVGQTGSSPFNLPPTAPAPAAVIAQDEPAPASAAAASSDDSAPTPAEPSATGSDLVPIGETPVQAPPAFPDLSPRSLSEAAPPAAIGETAGDSPTTGGESDSNSAAASPAASNGDFTWPLPPASEPTPAESDSLGSVLRDAATPATGAVQPASSDQPLAESTARGSAASPSTGLAAKAILARLLEQPADQALAGNPVTLVESLPLGSDRQKQIEVVEAYWEASLRAAVYHAALADLDRLASVPAPQNQRERVIFEQALLSAEATARQAELKAVDAQYALADKAGITIGDLLPLPSDEPFIGVYRTNYDSLFTGRTAPVALRRIDRTLPLTRRLIDSRSRTLTGAEEVWELQVDAYGRGEIPLETLLTSFDRLSAQRIAFLDLVRRYNFDIAQFALNVATTGASRETIVAMLIETDGVPSQSSIQPAAAVSPLPAGSTTILPGSNAPSVLVPSSSAPLVAPGRTYVLPAQPSPAVRPSIQPAGPTPAVAPAPQPGPSGGVLISPEASAPTTPIPSPAENAGPAPFREITPQVSQQPGDAREPASVALAPSESAVQPATFNQPLPATTPGRVEETPAPPGLEGTRSVLVRP